jgi:hypothetical protein
VKAPPGDSPGRSASTWELRHAKILKALPKDVLPQNANHGEKSWTLRGATACKIEVLIGGKTAAFMVKSVSWAKPSALAIHVVDVVA